MIRPDFLVECINNPFTYVFSQTPDKVPTIGAARVEGIDCVSHPTLMARLNGYYLPDDALPYELFLNTANIETVKNLGDMCLGDFVWLGPEAVRADNFIPIYDENDYLINWLDGPAQHMAVYAGRKSCGEPVYVHASPVVRTTVAQTLRELTFCRRANQINRIGRLKTPVGRLVTPTIAEIQNINTMPDSSLADRLAILQHAA